MPSLRLLVWNVIKLALNFLIAIFLSYNSRTRAGRLLNCLFNHLMNEFNPSLMTSLQLVRDLLNTASAPRHDRRRGMSESFPPMRLPDGRNQTMQMKETKWRVAAAICVALIYIFVTALSGRV